MADAGSPWTSNDAANKIYEETRKKFVAAMEEITNKVSDGSESFNKSFISGGRESVIKLVKKVDGDSSYQPDFTDSGEDSSGSDSDSGSDGAGSQDGEDSEAASLYTTHCQRCHAGSADNPGSSAKSKSGWNRLIANGTDTFPAQMNSLKSLSQGVLTKISNAPQLK
jgi:hypothetical protein